MDLRNSLDSTEMYYSVVSPVYSCKKCLNELYIRLKNTLEQITSNFEIILVNDASPDDAWDTIVELTRNDKRVKGINLSRNFGQHYAITAGLDYCSGEWVVVLDCDLQDKPEEIIKLHKKAMEGYDIVYGKRNVRQDNIYKKISSKMFYKVFSYLTDNHIDGSVANFCLANKMVIQHIVKMREHYRSYLLFLKWTGFKSVEIEIDHSARGYDKSSYSVSKLIKLAFNTIISFSDKPLRLAIKFGITVTLLSTCFILYLVIRNILYGTSVLGWTSLIASIFFSLGIVVTILGIIGLYLGRIFEEVKNRPLYVIQGKTF